MVSRACPREALGRRSPPRSKSVIVQHSSVENREPGFLCTPPGKTGVRADSLARKSLCGLSGKSCGMLCFAQHLGREG